MNPPPRARRGVASVLAMMFLVIFGSLCAAMAVVAQGNLRTADSALKLSHAMSAAETGMVFATRRLSQEASRFVVEKGVISADFAQDLWMGTVDTSTEGAVTVLPPTGYTTNTPPAGIIHAIRDAHAYDDGLSNSHSIIVVSGDSALPNINSSVGKLSVRPIRLNNTPNSAYFRLTYELLSGVPYVRVVSEGVDGDIHRTIELDCKIEKKIEFALLSPNRIMIGKNVLVEGPLGSRYGLVSPELDSANGDPLVMRSDFYYLAASLNTKLNTLYQQIVGHDVDGDARLRPDHPLEALGLSGQSSLVDYDGDEYVDDFDLFLSEFDSNSDQKICYSSALAAAAGLGGMSVEFTADAQLARLIDEANPDRDSDGEITPSDTGLGYRDGVLDLNDQYAKVRGRIGFSVAQTAWETPNGGAYQNVVQGPIRFDIDDSPAKFEVTDVEMREITTAMFSQSQSWFQTQTNGGNSSMGYDPVAGTFAAGPAVILNGTYTSAAASPYEKVPFGAPGPYDFYKRPIFENMVFKNVKIPKGTNALFKNCKFVGVTFIATEPSCADYNWNAAGAVTETPPDSGNFTIHFAGATAMIGGVPPAYGDTRPFSNNIRFDNCTFLGSIAGDKPLEYMHWRNKLQMTGNTRFYIDPADPDLAAQTDAATLTAYLNGISAADRDQLSRSSILMPGWSIDVGNFTNDTNADPTLTPKIKLKGTIIAGILDIRGTADVHGTLLMTFRPKAPGATLPDAAAGPLAWGGLTDSFNTTIGYFGPLDGDGEGTDVPANGYGEITLRYDPNAKLPDGIPWPVRIDPDATTYSE